ncbi:MAG: hypothetical protein MZU84_06540 [Sphingobacterium sp.]|nr:hypothetical protein [Sphingobacterium sp.]
MEKVAVKDVKLRTFITQDSHRDDLAAHVYDITYGSIRKGIDSLVVLDDSIVRGTTSEAEHYPDPEPPWAEEDHDRLFRTPDPLSGLLRDRHGQTHRLYRFQGHHRTPEGNPPGPHYQRPSIKSAKRRSIYPKKRSSTMSKRSMPLYA